MMKIHVVRWIKGNKILVELMPAFGEEDNPRPSLQGQAL